MKTFKVGQIVRFHTPFPDENPNQIYVIVEIADDGTANRATIKPLNFKFQFPPILTVKIADLSHVKVSALEMIGETVTLKKNDGNEVNGRVVSARDVDLFVEMTRNEKEVVTNCHLTIVDNAGLTHEGFYVFKA